MFHARVNRKIQESWRSENMDEKQNEKPNRKSRMKIPMEEYHRVIFSKFDKFAASTVRGLMHLQLEMPRFRPFLSLIPVSLCPRSP